MKKVLMSIMFAAISIAMVSSAYAAGATGITGTSHDLSSTGLASKYLIDTSAAGTNNRICVFCHAPHNTKKVGTQNNSNYNYMPLWNHTLSTAQTWTPYQQGAYIGDPNDPNTMGLNLSAAVANGPGGVSKLCLSCHDGSVAINAYGTNVGTTKMTDVTKLIGSVTGTVGDLSNHHPIGFNYEDVFSKNMEIAASTTVISSGSGIRIKDVLVGNNMECITCHDVHNSKNEATAEKFLWRSDNHSTLCLTCHKK